MESSGPRGLASLGYTVEVTAVESQKITIGIERSLSSKLSRCAKGLINHKQIVLKNPLPLPIACDRPIQ